MVAGLGACVLLTAAVVLGPALVGDDEPPAAAAPSPTQARSRAVATAEPQPAEPATSSPGAAAPAPRWTVPPEVVQADVGEFRLRFDDRSATDAARVADAFLRRAVDSGPGSREAWVRVSATPAARSQVEDFLDRWMDQVSNGDPEGGRMSVRTLGFAVDGAPAPDEPLQLVLWQTVAFEPDGADQAAPDALVLFTLTMAPLDERWVVESVGGVTEGPAPGDEAAARFRPLEL